MSDVRKTAALASLTAQYSDSESNGSDSEAGAEEAESGETLASETTRFPWIDSRGMSRSNSPANVLGSTAIESLAAGHALREHPLQVPSPLAREGEERRVGERRDLSSLLIHGQEEEYVEDSRPSSPVSFHRTLEGLSCENITIPPEPHGRCSNSLLEKINKLHDKIRDGQNMSIQNRKDFRNPSIYEKLIAYCSIDELGSNYPPDIYDPHKWGPESYYEELAKKQKDEMDRKERERKERTKVEFVTGTAKRSAPGSEGEKSREKEREAERERERERDIRLKKSKWDVPLAGASASNPGAKTVNPPPVLPVTAASGTKPIVISAVGSIKKR